MHNYWSYNLQFTTVVLPCILLAQAPMAKSFQVCKSLVFMCWINMVLVRRLSICVQKHLPIWDPAIPWCQAFRAAEDDQPHGCCWQHPLRRKAPWATARVP